jgi:hypothetical protein
MALMRRLAGQNTNRRTDYQAARMLHYFLSRKTDAYQTLEYTVFHDRLSSASNQQKNLHRNLLLDIIPV